MPIRISPLATLLLAGSAALSAASVQASVDAEDRRQTIEGFGTCIISWGKTARGDFYDDEMARIFTEEVGLNMLRVNVAPWGYPETADPEAITWKNITFGEGDQNNSRVQVFLDFAKKLKQHDEDIRIIGTVWSPPGWMKVNDEVTGGRGKKKEPSIQGNSYSKKNQESRNRMKPEYYPHFVNLIAEMCKLHDEHGVPFYAMSPGNEVMFSQSFESCVWTAEDFAIIVGMLGEELEKEGFGDVLIFGPETMTQHNWSIANPLYIKQLRQNDSAWEHFDRFATHGYVDGFEADMSADSSLAYWELIKEFDKPYWMTEGGTGPHEWPLPIKGVATAIHNSLVHGNASAFVPWQIATMPGKEPNSHGLMGGREMTKKTYAVKHYARFIDVDAVRLDIPEATAPLQVSAFHHAENGSLTIVVLNADTAGHELNLSLDGLQVDQLQAYRTTADEDCAAIDPVSVDEGRLTLAMPAESIVTLVANDLR